MIAPFKLLRLATTGLVALIGVLLLPGPAAAQEGTGVITGVVRDDYNGMTLPTAHVQVVGLDIGALSGMDGEYRLEVPPGTYELKASFPGYSDHVMGGIVVEAGATVTLDIVMRISNISLEETVIITATLDPELATAEAQLLERKRSPAISDNLSQQEMRANADSDAASAMRRVTGLSVVDDQYVYVRGLGERYSNTMLNGTVLPTTEPDKRVVPLDLIPTRLVESVQVIKTYLPDRPAEFSGGLVQIESVRAPRALSVAAATKQTFNSLSAFSDNGLTYPGGGNDHWGFDDGTRALPGDIPDDKVIRGSVFIPGSGYSPEELQAFGRSFANTWDPRPETYGQDQDYSASYGGRVGRFGLVASVGYRIKSRNREEEQLFYSVGEDVDGDAILDVQNDYDFQFSDTKTRLGVLGTASYELDASNRFSWANFWTHNSKNETRAFAGFNADINTDIRDARLYWIQEDLLSSTLRGEHLLGGAANSRIDWRANYSLAGRDEPDIREILYEFNESLKAFKLADESQSAFRMFNTLEDEIYEGAFDWSVFFSSWNGLPAQIKFGPDYLKRHRDFSSRRFRFTQRNVRNIDTTLPAEQILVAENINPDGFELKEETRSTDAYYADQDVLAGYVMLDLGLTQKLRFIGGVRVESSNQEVTTFDPFSPDSDPIVASLSNTDALPAVNLVYQLTSEMNLRGGYSRTLNRPEFRELSPFEFTDVVGGRAVVGNPDLVRALIDNIDLRWEWFLSPGEVLAASVFYKDFTNPIERVVEPTAQLRTSFTNALGAVNKGFELEARKTLGENFAVNLNYTYVQSEIDLQREVGQVQTSLVRPLMGQSPSVVNAQLVYSAPSLELDARVLFNYAGRRITDVGSLGLPDIYEEGRSQVDLVVSKRWGPWGFQLLASNLTDSRYLSTQGGEENVQRLYRVGRDIGFALAYAFR